MPSRIQGKMAIVVLAVLSLVVIVACIVVWSLPAGRAGQAVADGLPVLDISHCPAYFLALEASTDPRAAAIRWEIAAGTGDLAEATATAAKSGILMEPDAAPPVDNNAAPLYDRWESMCKTSKPVLPPYAEPLTLSYRYSSAEVALVQQWEDNNKSAVAVLMQANRKPSLYYPSNPEDPFDFPTYARLRGAAREFTTEATLLALKGKCAEAARVQSNGFAVERQCAQSPGFIVQMVAMAIDGITLSGLQSLLVHSPPDAGLSASIRSYVVQSAGLISPKRELQQDGSELIQTFETVTNLVISEPAAAGSTDNPQAYNLFMTNLFDESEARALNRLASAVGAADELPGKRRIDLARIANEPEVADDPCSAVDLEFHEYDKFIKKIDERAAREQELLAGAAILSVKARTCRYPAELPGSFIDPFSGKQLIYKRRSGGFVVYSVGPSGTFDGSSNEAKGWDSAFTYPASRAVPVPPDLSGN